jgi:hypothetical protein
MVNGSNIKASYLQTKSPRHCGYFIPRDRHGTDLEMESLTLLNFPFLLFAEPLPRLALSDHLSALLIMAAIGLAKRTNRLPKGRTWAFKSLCIPSTWSPQTAIANPSPRPPQMALHPNLLESTLGSSFLSQLARSELKIFTTFSWPANETRSL